jgi:hypothetical protein
MVLEEQLIGFLNPLANVLHSLRANLLPELDPLTFLSDMSLKLAAIQVFVPHSVIPFMERNHAVRDMSSDVNHALEIPISLVVVQLESQGFHTNNCTMICR